MDTPLTKDQIEICRLIHEGYSSHKIAAFMHCSQPNIFKKIKKLKQEGYVRVKDKFYYVTDSAMAVVKISDNLTGTKEVISPQSIDNPLPNTENKPASQQRLHNFQVKYALKSTVDEQARLFIAKAKEFGTPRLRKLKHHTDVIIDWDDITFIITTKSLIVTDIEESAPQGTSTYDLIFSCFQKADSVVTEIEAKLRRRSPWFSLVREGQKNILKGEIIKIELAHTHDIIAEHVERVDNASRFIVYRPGTTEPDVLVDHSHDKLEFEFVNKKTAIEYNEQYRQMKNDLGGTERVRLWVQDFFQNKTLNPWEDKARISELQENLLSVINQFTHEIMELKADKEKDISVIMTLLTSVTEKLSQVADILSMAGKT